MRSLDGCTAKTTGPEAHKPSLRRCWQFRPLWRYARKHPEHFALSRQETKTHISTMNTLHCQGKRPKHKRTHIFTGQSKTPCSSRGRPLFQAKTNRQLFYKVSRQISQLLLYPTTWPTGLTGNEERGGVPSKLLSVPGTWRYVGLKR